MELAGTVAVVTGATSGIGMAAALQFAQQGAKVAAVGRKKDVLAKIERPNIKTYDEDSLRNVVAECRALRTQAIAIPTDITDADSIERLAAHTVSHYGRFDTWVNAAAVLIAGDLDRTPVEMLDRLIATNVRGTMLTSRAALAQFREQRKGVLINFSSILGVVPNPVVPAYTMTKFAVRGLTLCLHHTAGLGDVHVLRHSRCWPCCSRSSSPRRTPAQSRWRRRNPSRRRTTTRCLPTALEMRRQPARMSVSRIASTASKSTFIPMCRRRRSLRSRR